MTSDIKIVELFPHARDVKYFAESGSKLPAKLKANIPYFLLINEPAAALTEPEPVAAVEEAGSSPTEEPAKKKRKSSKTVEESSPVAAAAEEVVVKKAAAVVKEDKYKLYMKATMNGFHGSKGETIEAKEIPNGTILHLVKAKKYLKTMIYYEGFWHEH